VIGARGRGRGAPGTAVNIARFHPEPVAGRERTGDRVERGKGKKAGAWRGGVDRL